MVNDAEEAAAPEIDDDDTLQGNASWASQVEEEEEDEAATAASKLEALTAAEKEEEELAAEIAAEVEEAERARASAMAEAALFSVSQSFVATSTPTHEKGSGKGDPPSSVESGSFILTPEMISCVSSLTGDSTNNNSVLINTGVVNGASPSLPSGHVAVIVTPAPVAPTAGTAAAAAAPPELLGATAAPSPSFQHLSARLQALGSAAMSAYSGSTAPKMPISRLPPRNRSASLKRGRGDETLDGDVSSIAKRNSSVSKDAKEMPSMSQRDLVALLKQPGQQQQRQSRTPTRGGQKGGKGGL